MKRLSFFLFAGAVGFVVDMGVLWLLLELKMLDPFTARAPAIGAALVCSYIINRTFTFGASHRNVAVEGVRYGGVGLVSTLINYSVYSGLLLLLPGLSPYLALIFGSGSATLFAYLGYSRFVFGPGPDV
ncbi:putative membrane protein [Hoeflea phototrophica DFL-43]|uniref:Putative membrane protein n=1 Tax=Hoeflea phototrophica (strain DSM 17068 / NCIMB 14078 / DFL-43) TaxID=411684 RepID=A9CWA7_HOEPD|nr:GtrA family protein [Hoeflea phototrophica]EDQ35493.1 putative membrane protein [Hoeflea phototrophica DFL-43]